MKFIASLIFSLTLAFTAFAQSPSKIIKQAEKALGGQKALKAVTSVNRTGRITRVNDGAEGKYLYQTSQPNLLNVSYDLAGFESETGYNGRSGWRRDSRNGLQTLTGLASNEIQAKAAYRDHLWLKAKDEKSKIVAGSPATINGKTANSIIINTQKGISINVYFDAATGLPLRDEIRNGSTVEVTDYTDYRSVNGILQAFVHRITAGGETYEVQFDDVRTNQQIARSEFDFPNISGEPLPDIPTLLKDLQANEDRVEALLDSYSFTQKSIRRELGKDGILREIESETKQMSFYKGNRIHRTIEKNDRPLSQKDQADVDKNVAKKIEEIDKRLAKEEARVAKQKADGSESEEKRGISIAEMLRASKLLNPRRERFRGRDCVVFDFEPNPAFDMKNAKSMLKFFGKTAGVVWIDEKDKQVARLEAVLFENFGIGGGLVAKLKKGATFMIEKERFGDEIWLPSQTDINISVRLLLIKGIDLNQIVKSYGYRRFETEVKDATVDGTKKP